MAKTAKQQLKTWFQNLKKPTQEQFWHWLDSYWHKDEKIPQSAIENWDEFLKSLPNDGELKNYLLKDGANINAENREVLRAKLGVGDLPPNLGLVDAEEEGNVYTKTQVEALLPTKNLSNANQIIPEGKIREIDVQGRLDIKNLEEKEQDDTKFSSKIVIDEKGTLAKKIDLKTQAVEIILPEKITVKNNFPDWSQPTSYQVEVSDQLKNLDAGEWKDVATDFWETGSIDNQFPELAKKSGHGFELLYSDNLKSYWQDQNTPEPAVWAKSPAIFSTNTPDFGIKFMSVLPNDNYLKARKAEFIEDKNNNNVIFQSSDKGNYLPITRAYPLYSMPYVMFYFLKIQNSVVVFSHTYYVYKVAYPAIGQKIIPLPTNGNFYLKFSNPQFKITNTQTKSL